MLEKLVYLKLRSGRRCLMNKNIVEKTLNDQIYRGTEKLVYLKWGSGQSEAGGAPLAHQTLIAKCGRRATAETPKILAPS